MRYAGGFFNYGIYGFVFLFKLGLVFRKRHAGCCAVFLSCNFPTAVTLVVFSCDGYIAYLESFESYASGDVRRVDSLSPVVYNSSRFKFPAVSSFKNAEGLSVVVV